MMDDRLLEPERYEVRQQVRDVVRARAESMLQPWEVLVSRGDPSVDPIGDAYAALVRSGRVRLSKVPMENDPEFNRMNVWLDDELIASIPYWVD